MKPILAALCLLSLAACSTIRPGNQTAQVRAEQVLLVSVASLDSFVAFEYRRRADVPPLVRDVAARVRLNAPRALDSANALRLAYKSNRTPENKASLLTALAVVESLVGEIRVWIPGTSASGPGSSPSDAMLRESQASQTGTAQSWAALVPVFIDLAREVYSTVQRIRAAAVQDAEWTLQQEADFSAQLNALKTAAHWSTP